MANDQIQKLYDEAFRHWQEKNKDKARELIDEALRLAPEDLSLHALAIHIKHEFGKRDHVPHAEFILDHDVHFKDTVDEHRDPFRYVDLLFLSYGWLSRHDDDDDDDDDDIPPGDRDELEIFRRCCHYAEKVLRAGYGLSHPGSYLKALSKLERYDDIIEIGHFYNHTKSAADIGLPGLDECDADGDFMHDAVDTFMSAFFHANRDEEALEWCRVKLRAEPNNSRVHLLMADVFSRLDQPEESARQMIIAAQKGADIDGLPDDFEKLCVLLVDPEAGAKWALWYRLFEVQDAVPPERKATFEKVRGELYGMIGDPKKKMLQDAYYEQKLGMKLPPLAKKHFRTHMWIPRTQGPHPFVKYRKKEATAVTPRVVLAKPHNIERYGIDLTERARAGQMPPIVGRDREIDAVVRILIRMEKNNPVLLGEAGVGKTAIAQGLAQRIVAGTVPGFLRNHRVYELTMSALVGGSCYRGEFETRMTGVIREARDNPDIILFVDELHTIMGAGTTGRGDLDAANMTKPALAKGELRLIGATTTREYTSRIERDQAMARRFTAVRVGEMNREMTLDVLRRRREHWLKFHKVEIPDDVITHAVEWTDVYVTNRKLPDKAIDLLDESCAHLRTRMSGKEEKSVTLTIDVLRRVLTEWTGAAGQAIVLPAESSTGDKQAPTVPPRDDILKAFREHVVAQDEAVDTLADVVVQMRLALKEPSVPLPLLLHGPAGTGKTTATHALARILWPDDLDRVMSLNLADFCDDWSLNRLIGTPLGYAEHEQGGILSARLKQKPHSIILLKNIAAGHPPVLEFLSDLVRHGGFTDAFGRRVSAADAIVIVHVNTSTDSPRIGFASDKQDDGQASQQRVFDDLKRDGVPDRLLCAIACVLRFPALSPETVQRVIRLRLDLLQKTFWQRNIRLEFTDALVSRLGDRFLELPDDRRNVNVLIDHHVRPLIRAAMLAPNAQPVGQIVIDVDQEVGG